MLSQFARERRFRYVSQERLAFCGSCTDAGMYMAMAIAIRRFSGAICSVINFSHLAIWLKPYPDTNHF